MSATIKEQGPKTLAAVQERIEAAKARELTAGDCRECNNTRVVPDYRKGGVRSCACAPGVIRPLPTTATDVGREACAAALLGGLADVENDGDRGPRARPLSNEDAARASQVAALMSAAGPLDLASLRVLTWIAGQLPAVKLRAACEAATATGWCRSDDPEPKARRTRVDGARTALLGAVREVEALLFRDDKGRPIVTARRERCDVLADEVERRAKAGVP